MKALLLRWYARFRVWQHRARVRRIQRLSVTAFGHPLPERRMGPPKLYFNRNLAAYLPGSWAERFGYERFGIEGERLISDAPT